MTIEGNIVNIEGTKRGRIEIGDDGIISSVGKETGKADLVLKDELIFPGFIDIHVHARECADHSWDYKEDFVSAGAAAINGGVVAFADMPNNPVPPLDDKSYAEKYQLAQKCPVEVVLYAGITPKTNPFSMSFRASASESRNPLNLNNGEIKGSPSLTLRASPNLHSPSDAFGLGRDDKLKVPYKLYLGKSTGNLFFSPDAGLEQVLEKYRGQSVSFHCEDPKIMEANINQPTHELQRPPEAETSAIGYALTLTEKYNLKGKICHVSTKQGLQKVIEAKKRGVDVTCEVTPHHLYFNSSVSLRINPPLRTDQDRAALIEGLKNGSIDFLATDHAPHSAGDRAKGASGLPHLDTYGPFVTWLIAEQGFTPADVLRVCADNPGKFFSQFSSVKYGKVAGGYAGALTIIDTHKPIKISKSMLKTKSAWSPFEDVTFSGSVAYTIIKGKICKGN